MIIAIFAVDSKHGIARNGVLPWPFSKEDMKWFKAQTTGHVVVMGRKTWDAPDMVAPLPNRHNAVFTRDNNTHLFRENLTGDVCKELRRLEAEHPTKTIFVIGGGTILEQASDVLDGAWITRMPGDYECDTFVNLQVVLNNLQLKSTTPLGTATLEIYLRRKDEGIS